MMYPWATKEYILWEMTWAQVIMYMNEGLDQKYGKAEKHNAKKAVEMTYDELAVKREELREMERLRKQYGKID